MFSRDAWAFQIFCAAVVICQCILGQTNRDICSFPVVRGPCSSLSTRWYYSRNFKRCLPFFYGGCQGNANNFRTRKLCQKACKLDDAQPGSGGGFSPCARVRCDACSDCRVNRFQEPRCVRRPNCCLARRDQISCLVDPCIDRDRICPQSVLCVAVYCRTCRAIYYDDLFNEIRECSRTHPSTDSCRNADCGPCGTCIPNPRDVGTYSCTVDRDCEEQRQCAVLDCGPGSTCKIVAGSARCVTDARSADDRKLRICRLKDDPGPCRSAQVRFYHDPFLASCQRFTYGGCQGNENNFRSLAQCEQFCNDIFPCPAFTLTPAPQGCRYIDARGTDFCPQPKLDCSGRGGNSNSKPGSCPNLSRQFGCNARCRSDSDCPSREKCCRTECGGNVCVIPTNTETSTSVPDRQRICRLPKEVGPCRASIPRFFFDGVDCQGFMYGGCQGNENRFDSLEECRRSCVGNQPCPVQPMIEAPPGCQYAESTDTNGCPIYDLVCLDNDPCASNPCQNCETCRSLQNRRFQCIANQTCLAERQCSLVRCRPDHTCQVQNGRARCVPDGGSGSGGLPARCLLPQEKGPCEAAIPAWFYNRVSGRCERFNYGGCRGNSNRFQTREWCNRVCVQRRKCLPRPLPAPPPNCNYDSSQVDAEGCPSFTLVCNNNGGSASGSCPASNARGNPQTCIFECNSDRDCDQGRKCCPNVCGRTCKHVVSAVNCPLRPRPAAPPPGCQYRSITLPNGCQDFELECNTAASPCQPNPCSRCEVCIPETKFCITQPCPQYRCESRCGRCEICSTTGQCVSNRVPCRTSFNPCLNARCPSFPNARCVPDDCDCTKAKYVNPNTGREIPVSACTPNPRNGP